MNHLLLRPGDDVAIALEDLAAGVVAGDSLRIAERVPRGHKFAVRPIPAGAPVRKLGQVIGVAAADIAAGHHVHVHNIDASQAPRATGGPAPPLLPRPARREFLGYRRTDGRVGTRNCLGVISTVNCSATVVREIVNRARQDAACTVPGIDAIVPITHTTGCGMTAGGAGITLLQQTLGGFLGHPNFAGVLLVGLGCESNDIESLLTSQDLRPSPTLRTLTIQAAGGTRAAIDAGLRELRALAVAAATAERQPLSVAHLTLGLQCGGSDSFSAVTANPALGVAADCLVAAGGTVLLAETPEIHGAEGLLLARVASAAVAADLEAKLAWWEDYVARNEASLNNNPSPGNIAGGISTIYEKSLGAVAKAGTSMLNAVTDYGRRSDARGLVFMDSPGYDPCSVTGEIAAGANLVCFTTGRGSVFGSRPVPAVKLATNTSMARHMADDIDYDCGQILSGRLTLEAAGAAVYELLLDVASGKPSASERNGLGDFEFVPWQLGAVL